MWFYRAMLRLYPAAFRVEYGDEMVHVFGERLARADHAGQRILLLLDALADVVPNALAVHWDVLRQDLRYTSRVVAHQRGFALTAVLVVALGVGANTAAFSVADFVLLRPLPFPNPDHLVMLWERTPGYAQMELSPGNYRDWKAMARSFSAVAAFSTGAVNLVSGGEPRRISSATVEPDLFPLLGVRPALGRIFEAQDARADDGRTVVLGFGLWQSAFGGAADVVGRTVNLDGQPFQVIGVMPPDFLFPSRDVQIWTPLELREPDFVDRNNNYLKAVARLRDGVTLDQARADLALIAERLERRFPRANAGTGATVYRLRDQFSERSRLLLLGLCGAALCLLLLTCANLANLLLARAAARRRELAVRAALGAGRERLVRQLLTESVLLAAAGGGGGLLVALAVTPMLARLVPNSLPIAQQPALDARVLTLAVIFTALTGVGFGVLPALRAGGRGGLGALRHDARAGGGRRQRLRAALVGIEVAVSVTLLASAGLLVRALWRLQAVDPGFRTEDVLTLRTALPRPTYASTARRTEFYDHVLSEVRALPGVRGAAFTSFLPIAMGGGIWPVVVQGDEVLRDAANAASLRFVTPGFFQTLEIPIGRGRDVSQSDTFDRPFVAVVSESFASRYWPDQNPIGQHFEFAFADRTVVGVVRDIHVRGLEQTSEPQVYLPYRQVADGALPFYTPKDLVVQTTVDPHSVAPAVRRIVHAVDPEQPVSNLRTMEEVVAGQMAPRRAQLGVLAALAVIALVLTGVGIHGLLAFTVSQRTREIGVRLALGARPARVATTVLREALVLAGAGVLPGILAAYWAASGMRALLFGVRPTDPAPILLAVGLVVTMTLLGSLLPTLRAARTNPMEVMRAE